MGPYWARTAGEDLPHRCCIGGVRRHDNWFSAKLLYGLNTLDFPLQFFRRFRRFEQGIPLRRGGQRSARSENNARLCGSHQMLRKNESNTA